MKTQHIDDKSVRTQHIPPEDIVVQRRAYVHETVNTPAPGSTPRNLVKLTIPCVPDCYTDVEYDVNIDPLPRKASGKTVFDTTLEIQAYAGSTKLRAWKVKFGASENINRLLSIHLCDTTKRSGNVTYTFKVANVGPGECDLRQHHIRLMQVKR